MRGERGEYVCRLDVNDAGGREGRQAGDLKVLPASESQLPGKYMQRGDALSDPTPFKAASLTLPSPPALIS